MPIASADPAAGTITLAKDMAWGHYTGFRGIRPLDRFYVRNLIEELAASGLGRQRISLALLTRERTSLQIPWQQMAADLGVELAGLVSPAPEQAHQSAQNGAPLVLLHPDTLVGDQMRKLAANIASELQLS